MAWQDKWKNYVKEQTVRHAQVGIKYPISADEPISEIVALAIMSQGSGKPGKKK